MASVRRRWEFRVLTMLCHDANKPPPPDSVFEIQIASILLLSRLSYSQTPDRTDVSLRPTLGGEIGESSGQAHRYKSIFVPGESPDLGHLV